MKRALMGLLLGAATAGSLWAGQFSPGLERMVAGMAGSEPLTVLLALERQADIPAIEQYLQQTKASLAERHELVVGALQRTAEESQADLIAELESLRADGKVEGFTPYWLVNGIVVRAPLAVLRDLATRPDVEQVEANLQVELIEPIQPEQQKPFEDGLREARVATPGVQAVRAPDVWNLLGIDGSGVIVGILDTGVQATHPALSSRYRGNNGAPHSHSWFDAAGFGDSTPIDRHYHGTHVMGTVCGGAPGEEIGVAPGAQWIASNVINMSTGTAFDNAVIASLQFMADPDGNPGTIDDVPAVVQNSWGVNENFSGYFDCDSRWWAAIDNCEAAGVVLTWSAGNEGPGGTSLRSPADRAASPYNAFSVGSTLNYSPYNISSFSSRGPSGCGGAHATKPEVVAPGSDIWSADPGGGYRFLSGTSMAGPHVAGVVALMRAANPNVDVNTIKQVLMDTAIDLGTVGEDNTYGWGFVDAYEAVQAVMTGYGTLTGTVTDSGASPLGGVSVSVVGGIQSTTTAANGSYTLMLPADNYIIRYEGFGYIAQEIALSISEDATTTRNVQLVSAPSAQLSGVVYNPAMQPVVGATIEVLNAPIAPTSSGAGGSYALTMPTGFTYELRAFAPGLGTTTETLVFNGATSFDFHLPIDPTFLPSGPDSYGYRIFDSNDAGGLPFEWNSISGSGTALSLGDDAVSTVTLPWPIQFYGSSYSQLTVSSNGAVFPGASGATAFSNQPIPVNDSANGMVCGHWDDLNPNTGGTVYVQALADRYVVEYADVSYYGGGGTVSLQIQLLHPVLYPTQTGDVQWLVHYQNGSRASETVGIENPAGTVGVQYLYNGTYDEHASSLAAGNMALLISTNENGFGSPEDTLPPTITHVPLPDTQDAAGPWSVTADINDYSGVASATLEYRFNGGAWLSQGMSPVLNNYSAQIPGPRPIGTQIEYRIRAIDASENANQGLSPVWSFLILAPTGLEYCQNFEDGFDDFSVATYDANGNTWIINDFSGQGQTAYIQYGSSFQEDHSGLLSPIFDCSGQATLELEFWHRLRMGYSGYWSDAYVRGSTDGGVTWPHLIAEWHSTDNGGAEFTIQGSEVFDLTSWAAGESQVRLQFEYHGLYDWYWNVDDVCLTGTLAQVELDAPVVAIQYVGGSQAQLSWDAIPGASEYDVYVSTAYDQPFSLLTSIPGLSLLVNTNGGQTAIYQVVARAGYLSSTEASSFDPLRNLRPLTPEEEALTK
jgi:subtilisin family serine protease